MTKIKNTGAYPIKKYPVVTDFFIGSDSENEGETVNFSIQTILNLVSGFIEYIYSNSSLPITTPAGDGYFQSNGVTNFSLITSLSVSKITLDGQNLTPLILYIKQHLSQYTLHLTNKSDKNNFAYYTITDITENPAYFVFTVTLGPESSYLGSLVHTKIYAFTYEKISSGSTDLISSNIPVVLGG